MFEVGKLADESMDSFIVELGKVGNQTGWKDEGKGEVLCGNDLVCPYLLRL